MRLNAKIRNGLVIESSLCDKYGDVVWTYYYSRSRYNGVITEKFFDRKKRSTTTYRYVVIEGKKTLTNKTYAYSSVVVEETFFDNGNISTRQITKDGIPHAFGKPSVQTWYSNGIRKLVYHYTYGRFNNPAGPAVLKWNSNGYLLRHKYYSHGYRIHYEILADRVEKTF